MAFLQDWVVGKYGRVLPVVHLRRKDKKKVNILLQNIAAVYCNNCMVVSVLYAVKHLAFACFRPPLLHGFPQMWINKYVILHSK